MTYGTKRDGNSKTRTKSSEKAVNVRLNPLVCKNSRIKSIARVSISCFVGIALAIGDKQL